MGEKNIKKDNTINHQSKQLKIMILLFVIYVLLINLDLE